MARPTKDGVDYFPKDTDFYTDDKVRLLRAEFGAKGMYLLEYILCDLYRINGYYMNWDKTRCYLVSDGAGCGLNPEFVNEFIAGCLRCSFFDEGVFNMFSVLTSPGIQRRYIRMFKGREEIQIKQEYFLLDTASKKDVPTGILTKLAFENNKREENLDKREENLDKREENLDKTSENSQSKVNKSKVNKSKVTSCENASDVIVPVEIQENWNAYIEMRNKIKKPLVDHGKKLALSKLNNLSNGNFVQQNAILEQSILNSWQGLFELKETQKGQVKQNNDYSHESSFIGGES